MTVRFGKAPALAGIKKFFFRFFFRKGFYCGLLRIAEKHNRLRSYIFFTQKLEPLTVDVSVGKRIRFNKRCSASMKLLHQITKVNGIS